MIYLQFLIGFICHGAMAFLSYHSGAKASSFYFPIAMCIAVVSNATWMYMAKTSLDSHKLILIGVYWDFMINMCFLAVPLLFFNVVMTRAQYVGIGLVLLGLIVTHL